MGRCVTAAHTRKHQQTCSTARSCEGVSTFGGRVRRLVSFTVLLTLFTGSSALLALSTFVAAAVDLLRDRRFPATRAVWFVQGVLTLEVLGLLGALFTLRHRDAVRFREANYALQRWWAGAIIGWVSWVYRLQLVVEGDALPAGPFLLLPRHASLADPLLPMAITALPVARRPRYVLTRGLEWGPCLDVVGHRVPNVFVDRHASDASEVERVAALADELGPDEFVVIYPEGTRFSYARRASLLDRLSARSEPDRLAEAAALQHVLPVRPRGTLALLERRPIDVVLMAHVGLDAAHSVGELLRGELIGRTVGVRLRHVPAGRLPSTPEGRAQWLRASWRWMDEAVGAMQRPDLPAAAARTAGAGTIPRPWMSTR
jgi:1-acyl-sn-glycerol-3-phosphate acyltransferase